MSTAVSDDIWSSTNVLDKLKFWLYDGGIKNHGIAKVSLGNDECLSQILWKSMQILSKHFTQNYKSQPDDGARINQRIIKVSRIYCLGTHFTNLYKPYILLITEKDLF